MMLQHYNNCKSTSKVRNNMSSFLFTRMRDLKTHPISWYNSTDMASLDLKTNPKPATLHISFLQETKTISRIILLHTVQAVNGWIDAQNHLLAVTSIFSSLS